MSRLIDGFIYRAGISWGFAGFDSLDWLLLVGVAILWFLIGQKIDRQISSPAKKEDLSPARLIWNILVFLFGVDLLVVVSLHNVVFTNPRNGTGGDSNFIGDVIWQSLWLVWSVALIVSSSFSLLKYANRGSFRSFASKVR